MRWYVPPLSATADASHFVWRYRYQSKGYWTLFLGLIFFTFPGATVSITPSYSAPTQCGPFTITWVGQWPPFELLIMPFDADPVWSEVPAPGQGISYSTITNTSSYTLEKLRLKGGTQFLVTLDFGYGTLDHLISHFSQSAYTTFWPRPSKQINLTEMYL